MAQSVAGQQEKVWWGTPVLVRRFADTEAVNRGLREAILAEEAPIRGMRLSNVGGWHSKLDLMDWEVPS